MKLIEKQNLILIKECILNKNVSFVLVKNCIIERQDKDIGVKPIMKIINEDSKMFSDAFVGDKIIGKAAACLLMKYKVREIFADIISKPACEILDKHGVLYTYNDKVDNIRNRTNTDLCPLEKSVLNISDLDMAEIAIRNCIKELMTAK